MSGVFEQDIGLPGLPLWPELCQVLPLYEAQVGNLDAVRLRNTKEVNHLLNKSLGRLRNVSLPAVAGGSVRSRM